MHVIMTTEVIVIIIGLILMLVSVLGSISSGEEKEPILGAAIRVGSGLIGIMLIIFVGFTYGSINMQGNIEQPAKGNVLEVSYPIQRIQIISPIAGDAVECRILSMGVYPDSHEKDIWVLLKPSDGKYYPQSDHTNTSYKRNGEWQVITRFGGDQLENYEIIVYETNADASAFFTNTIDQWKIALDYPGLEEADLPDGAIEVDRILVSLKENCRGVF